MRKTGLVVLVGAVIIAGAGFGVNKIFAGESDPTLTVQEVTQKVEERYPGKVKEVERDDKGSHVVYEIELAGSNGEYEIKMDANTGEILKVEQQQVLTDDTAKDSKDGNDDEHQSDNTVARDDDQEQKPSDDQGQKQPKDKKRISYEQAKKVALSKFDGKITEIELDEDDGRWIYDVEIKNGKQEADVEIDAYTGEVLFMSVENDD
ncbi:PepSY domain-containing protein [Desmospora activa]|uniref:Peptidase YpeB-like protein n=1 Tax=Desmospora activa DSM 45169 TaxID=1121389 RepID=A0A2T4YXU0_9BACL|nr:PepSY domain-containing protein [Desmospora activa]PTM51332.1 peptidase YpeB-like protein [Desmospora activa DSM 45169]